MANYSVLKGVLLTTAEQAVYSRPSNDINDSDMSLNRLANEAEWTKVWQQFDMWKKRRNQSAA